MNNLDRMAKSWFNSAVLLGRFSILDVVKWRTGKIVKAARS